MASVVRYRRMVERLEREARQAPGRYRFKLALLAGLGFLVLGGSIVLALGMSVGLVVVLLAISPVLLLKLIKVIWIPVAFGWFMLKSLWIRVTPPDGYHLREGEAPQLRAEIEWLREQTGAPPLTGIVIDSQLNAAAASVPRAMGLLGHSHYLVLGLPLMQLLSREQFDAVVAHEFGHFGGGHGRFRGWIYRVRVSWYRVVEGLAMQRSWTTKVFRRFFDWYAPFFDAYSFVLARANEYEADATSARVVGAPATASALQRVGVCAARLDREFWPGVQRSVQHSPQPPAALFRDMATSFSHAAESDSERLAELLREKPGLEDTHPTLAQRLEALGQAPGDVAPPRRTAADSLLGPLQDQLEEHFSHEWREGVEENWRERHGQHERDRARLSELAALTARNADEAAEHARLVDDLCPDVDAVPLYRDALAANGETVTSISAWGCCCSIATTRPASCICAARWIWTRRPPNPCCAGSNTTIASASSCTNWSVSRRSCARWRTGRSARSMPGRRSVRVTASPRTGWTPDRWRRRWRGWSAPATSSRRGSCAS